MSSDEPSAALAGFRPRTPVESLEWLAGQLREHPGWFDAGTVAVILANTAQRLRDEAGPELVIDFPKHWNAEQIARFKAAWNEAQGDVIAEYRQAGEKLHD